MTAPFGHSRRLRAPWHRWLAGYLLAAGLGVAAALPVAAHEIPEPTDQSGIAIPAIDHGAMGVLDRYRDTILDLARSVPNPAPDLATLLVFQERQIADCLWLLLPGSVSDAENPLNLCAHAETATLKAMLETLRLLPGETGARTRALLSVIDADMLKVGTSYALCIHSGESFNTASPVRPSLGALAAHLANGYTIAAILGVVAFGVARRGTGRSRRRDSGTTPAG